VRVGIRTRAWLLVTAAMSLCAAARAQDTQDTQPKPADLANASLEDLMKVEVISVSKKEQTLSRTAAAVFVITQDEIARSGATNIPDLLRMVPGLNVAQINGSTWAVSARGLNGQFSNELLVMVDGRNVYTPTFGGVFWDTLDLPLENIERIEVIRGPGASVWGENAVNGVVNIIRKKAADTRGVFLTMGGGNTEQTFGAVQYGGSAGDRVNYRVYGKYFDNKDMRQLAGPDSDGGDGWHLTRVGARTDAQLSDRDTLIVQGDMYTGREGDPTYTLQSLLAPGLINEQLFVNVSGGFVQSIWTHTFSERSDTTLSGSYDMYERSDLLQDHRKTGSLDFRHHYAGGERQEVVWGATFRYTTEESQGSTWLSLVPPDQNETIFSFFVQDEIKAIPDRIYVTVGSKFENNTYSGFAAMPTARAVYQFNRRRMAWAAVSRAVRSPAEIDTSLRLNVGATTLPDGTLAAISSFGNPKSKDEGLVAYEAGYRMTLRKSLSVDVAAYYNDYDNQDSEEPEAPFIENTPAPPHLVLATIEQNLIHGETHGAELSAKWKPNDRWTLDWSYDFERIHMHQSAGSLDFSSGPDTEGGAPHQQASIQSAMNLTSRLSWNAWAEFTDRLAAQNVPSYTRVDTNLIWRIRDHITFGVYGQNLLRDRHLEYFDPGNSSTRSTLIRRSGYAKLTWRF
jgi:iron complex outermembrane receptor protein